MDIERNLRAPLTGIRHTAQARGIAEPDIRVAVRTGDTGPDERRRLATKPPDILITTPESLFLLLTSQARETLRNVETVIVDEVHALAGGKRGAHLALSLERLDALNPDRRPAQRSRLGSRPARRRRRVHVPPAGPAGRRAGDGHGPRPAVLRPRRSAHGILRRFAHPLTTVRGVPGRRCRNAPGGTLGSSHHEPICISDSAVA